MLNEFADDPRVKKRDPVQPMRSFERIKTDKRIYSFQKCFDEAWKKQDHMFIE